MLCKENKSQLYRYVNNRLGRSRLHPVLLSDDSELSDSDAIETFSDELFSNFSFLQGSSVAASRGVGGGVPSVAGGKQLQFNCTSADVMAALACCANSAAVPDGVSFRLVKKVSAEILLPLTAVFQQSLFQGKFPTMSKCENVVPLYKGKGDRSKPSAHRPIGLCPCLGNLLEKVILVQFTTHINSMKPLSC